MNLHDLPSIKNGGARKRVGRGPGSNWGKTCGKGQKGQKSRAGYSAKRGFEGGQMPISRRLPKFGFTPLNKIVYKTINLNIIEDSDRFVNGGEYNKSDLREMGLCGKNDKIKILGTGDLSKTISIQAEKFSKTALAKIENVGGKAIVVENT
jgi:large subunit ribosomal protein L15